jgi:Tyrosine phosphatase family
MVGSSNGTSRGILLCMVVGSWQTTTNAYSILPVTRLSRHNLATGSTIKSSTTNMEGQQQQQRTAVNYGNETTEDSFLATCKALCEQRNFPFEKIKNARDLASVRNSPVVPGRILRMGRVSDATETDIKLLLSTLGIQTLVDLRSPTELKDDPTLLRPAVFANFTNILWQEQGRLKDGCLKALEPGQGPVTVRRKFWQRGSSSSELPAKEEVVALAVADIVATYDNDDDDDVDDLCSMDCDDPNVSTDVNLVSKPNRKERHFVSLMNEFKYVKGTVSKLRKRDITAAILKSPGAVFSKRMRDSLKKPFLDEINDGGLPMLNELLLRFGAPGIRYVLELCADERRYPITFYCTAGKDRTGMIAAIILSLCGTSHEDIVEDYTLSANVYAEMNDHQAMVGALSQRNLDPKTFLGAPASVMRDTLQAIVDEYGSVEGYCNWIGFGPEKQEQLRQACMKPRA